MNSEGVMYSALPHIFEWSPIKMGDFPAYLGVVAAIVAIVFAGLSWRKQRHLTNEQLKDIAADRARTTDLEVKAHASKISAWPERRSPSRQYDANQGTFLVLLNNSDEPVYNVVATLVFVQGAGAPRVGEDFSDGEFDFRRHLGYLPPGRFTVEVANDWGAMGVRPGAEIAFTDRLGQTWIRRAMGALEPIPTIATDHYKMYGPFDFGTPDRDDQQGMN